MKQKSCDFLPAFKSSVMLILSKDGTSRSCFDRLSMRQKWEL